jgi:hypothetical protein
MSQESCPIWLNSYDALEHYFTIWPRVTHGALSLIPITPQIQTYIDAMTTYLKGVLIHS